MTPAKSYLLCGTPRTGSTFLCDLLTSTGVAGRPESFFREADEGRWAKCFGVPVARDGSLDYRALVAGAIRAGTSANGVFAARIMWGSIERIVSGLGRRPPQRDLEVLSDAFGPLVLVHLRREGVVGQAVSWARAEQTGYWQDGDTAASVRPELDVGAVDVLARTIREHNACWSAWFREQGVEPHLVTYEELVADPGRTVMGILDLLGVQPRPSWRPESRHVKQADEVNAEWLRRYDSWAN